MSDEEVNGRRNTRRKENTERMGDKKKEGLRMIGKEKW